MLKFFFTRYLDRFERRWGYDASYMHEVLAVSPWSFLKYSLGSKAADFGAAPFEVMLAVGLYGTLAEDCGPCTQIGVDMATAAGADPAMIRAILAGDEAAMGETAALGWRFARASLARDMEACDPLRDEIVRRWGRKGLVAIGLNLTSVRMYPTLKYALGHGKTCSKVVVAGVAAPVAQMPLAA
jgi:hypothetical protein